MYLHLGQAVVVPERDIIGVFDLDNASWSHRTRRFLEKAEKEGRVVSAAGGIRSGLFVSAVYCHLKGTGGGRLDGVKGNQKQCEAGENPLL